MNTIIKKCSAITLAVTLCCSVFAGCSSEQADKTADSGFQIKTNAVVSYLGPEGTYTEEAAKFFFQDTKNFNPQKTVDDAIAEVMNDTADYAVIPQENTLGGAVTNYVDALINESGVYVVGEVIIPINQTLMGVEGATLNDIKTVCSHAQGLTQSTGEGNGQHCCRGKLRRGEQG